MDKSTLPLVAIVGRPNVGKSTLFNRLAGRNRALVQETPGVTRDLHYAEVTYRGRRFLLVDTGGLSTEFTDELTAEVNAQVDIAMEAAAAIIFLMDGRAGLNPEDEELAERLRKARKPVFFTVNKVDSAELEHLLYDFYKLGIQQLFAISAREKVGVDTLFAAVTADFPKSDEESDDREDEARPVRIAFVGTPNVGKSSLINRILGEKRLIVSAIPGTTRDAIDVPFSLDGRDYILVDTAGLRRKSKVDRGVEKLSAVKALQALERTDIAVILHDINEPLSDQTMRILSIAEEKGRGMILVFNKVDLVRNRKSRRREMDDDLDRRLQGLEWLPRLQLSAVTGEGIEELFAMIGRVRANQLRRLPTGPLNRYLEQAVTHHGPPAAHGRAVSFYYMTQAAIRPPTFLAFTNQPGSIHFAYRRYLMNRLREAEDFVGTPIRLIFKGRRKEKR